ncbi:hypothetical protein CAL7716_107570 (plasmid) [Calothrix sp. PCC 7716]|nr:hypothetical protein CAL7716_107570 [Calothrix sp. PCC 7716]
MSADKIRIRKNIRPKVEKWCDVLDVTESEFAHEALKHYIRFLEGLPTGSNIVPFPGSSFSVTQNPIIENEIDNFDGGIAL